MKFWDTSALLLLLVEQPASREARALFRADANIVVWKYTRVEVMSALHRLHRDGALSDEDFGKARQRAEALLGRVTVIEQVDAIGERAETAVAVHPLRTLDALQLGAALVMADDRPRKGHFVAVDGKLHDAARAQGFATTRIDRML